MGKKSKMHPKSVRQQIMKALLNRLKEFNPTVHNSASHSEIRIS